MKVEAYWDGFTSYEDMRKDFGAPAGPNFPAEPDVLFAAYDCPDYEGDATVVYRAAGQLYIVTASHCSCYGLDGQWEPSAVSLDDLRAHEAGKFWHNNEDKAAFAAMVAALGE